MRCKPVRRSHLPSMLIADTVYSLVYIDVTDIKALHFIGVGGVTPCIFAYLPFHSGRSKPNTVIVQIA